MSNKLIDLDALSTFKTNSDLKYQDKLSTGDSISINNGLVSVTPTFVNFLSGSKSVAGGNAVRSLGSITLMPGNYILSYTCQFASSSYGSVRRCGFSTSNIHLDSFGSAYFDSRVRVAGTLTHTSVFALFQVSATTYPNGRTFYFLASHNGTAAQSITAYPRCFYLKF